MDSQHLYMDPLHPFVWKIFNKCSGCPCCTQRFHNLYNRPCCSTNPWHPLWPSTLNQLQRGVATYTQHFRGSTIAHWENIFNISNGYFAKSHLDSCFERYHQLNLCVYLTQGGCMYHHIKWSFSPCSGNYKISFTYGWKYLFNISNGHFTESHLASWFERYDRLNLSMYLIQGGLVCHIFKCFLSLLRKLQKDFLIILEISLQYIKWVFHGISFCCLVYEISLFEAAHVCNQCSCTPFKFNLIFITPWATSEQVSHSDGNISLVAQMNFWQNWIWSPVEKIMNRFAEECLQPQKSRFFHAIF